jgi:hypothetical protein
VPLALTLALILTLTLVATLAIVSMISAIITSVLVTVFILMITMVFLIVRNIFALVPVVLHKVDPLATGVVFVAMLAPVVAMARGYAQIYRFALIVFMVNYSRLSIVDLRLRIWKVANVDAAIEAGLPDAH